MEPLLQPIEEELGVAEDGMVLLVVCVEVNSLEFEDENGNDSVTA